MRQGCRSMQEPQKKQTNRACFSWQSKDLVRRSSMTMVFNFFEVGKFILFSRE